MPPVKKKAEAPTAMLNGRPVLYPEVEVNGIKIPMEKTIIRRALWRKLLGWEDEDAYKKRIESEAKGDPVKAAKAITGYGDEYLLKDFHGRKVRCWNNDRNRPFGESWAYSIAQDILRRNWRFNGETIIISKTGLDESGQHRLIGAELAAQMWESESQGNHWKEFWPEEPYIQSLVVFGVGEDQATIRTLDNVRQRNLADVFYTSESFRDLNPTERKECSRMLDKALCLVWRRSQAGEDPFERFQTHSTSVSFLDRHPRLLECVRHLFEENKNRAITKLRLSAGTMAGACYLMGSSTSDVDAYREVEPTSEKNLDWERWDKAQEFFVLLASPSPDFKPVREALKKLVDPETGNDGRVVEKLVILAKAWDCFLQGGPITVKDVFPKYHTDDTGTHLNEWPTFGGIDLGEKTRQKGNGKNGEQVFEMTDEELEAQKEATRKKTAEDAKATVARKSGK